MMGNVPMGAIPYVLFGRTILNKEKNPHWYSVKSDLSIRNFLTVPKASFSGMEG